MKALQSSLMGLVLLLCLDGPASGQLVASLISREKGEDPAHFAARQAWECAGILSTTADMDADIIGVKFSENSKLAAVESESYAESLSKEAGVSKFDATEAAHRGATMVRRAYEDSNSGRIEHYRKKCIYRLRNKDR